MKSFPGGCWWVAGTKANQPSWGELGKTNYLETRISGSFVHSIQALGWLSSLTRRCRFTKLNLIRGLLQLYYCSTHYSTDTQGRMHCYYIHGQTKNDNLLIFCHDFPQYVHQTTNIITIQCKRFLANLAWQAINNFKFPDRSR